MVKELGTFFEEFVKEYFHIKEECEFVEVNYHFKIRREDYRDVEGKERQAHWSDIDVLGAKADVIYAVSCKEYIGQQKDANKIQKHLSFAERAIRRSFPGKRTVKKIACVTKNKELTFKNVEVIYLVDMFKDMIKKIREQVKGSDSQGSSWHVKYPFEWLIRDLDAAGFFIGRNEVRKIYGFPPKNYITSRKEH